MAFVDINSGSDRKKLIIAAVLGLLALVSLWFAFGGSSSGTKTAATASPTPKLSPTPGRSIEEVRMPSQQTQDLTYQSTPVVYDPSNHLAPDPGRNIFAFYEPPIPCRDCPPPPTPIVTPPPQTPLPEAPYAIGFVTPQSIYAGTKTFRLEVTGDRFTPEARINFNGVELPTTFIGPQKLAANVPANMVASAGSGKIVVRDPSGTKYSYPTMISVQPPPKPNFQFIGMIARKRGNNDTGYFLEQGKDTPLALRLNDVTGGRFRLIDVSPDRAVFEDMNLGFKHTLELYRPAPGTAVNTGAPTRPGFQQPGGFPGNPNFQNMPGFPNGFPNGTPPRYVPPNSNTAQPSQKKDEDDEDDEDTDNRER